MRPHRGSAILVDPTRWERFGRWIVGRRGKCDRVDSSCVVPRSARAVSWWCLVGFPCQSLGPLSFGMGETPFQIPGGPGRAHLFAFALLKKRVGKILVGYSGSPMQISERRREKEKWGKYLSVLREDTSLISARVLQKVLERIYRLVARDDVREFNQVPLLSKRLRIGNFPFPRKSDVFEGIPWCSRGERTYTLSSVRVFEVNSIFLFAQFHFILKLHSGLAERVKSVLSTSRRDCQNRRFEALL